MIRQLIKESDLYLKYVTHFGYVSLFPLMTRILKLDSNKLEIISNDIQNSTLLWSPFGLRSIGKI